MSTTTPIAPTHLTCTCGNVIPITPPLRRKGKWVPACPNCGTTTGVTIEYERIQDTVTYKILDTKLAPPSRRVDVSKSGADLTPLESYFAARYPALLIETQEPARTIETMMPVCARANKTLYVWDCVKGLVNSTTPTAPEECDPAGVLDQAVKLPEHSVIVLKNFHHFLSSIDIIQRIENAIPMLKARCQTLIALAPTAKLPIELDRLFTVLDARLPTREEILSIIQRIEHDHHLSTTPDQRARVQEAATGLTAYEIENALCLSILRTQHMDPKIVMQEKAQLIRKNGGLEMAVFGESFATLGGADNLKRWILQRFRTHQQHPTLPLKGALLLGPPGCGKSHFAKALGNEVGRPTLMMDFGRMFTGETGREGIVGSAEAMIRRALAIADAMAPCLLLCDEIDKGLSGTASSNQTDGGTGSRIFGTFLKWLQDHTSEVYVIAAANDVSAIPPEFLRAGRWDGMFYVDLPNEEEQQQILNLYAKEFQVKLPSTIQSDLDLEGWSGAELRQLCIEAAYQGGDFTSAANYVIPLSYSAKPYITAIRKWAESRCISARSANKPSRSEEASGPPPSLNTGHYV